MGKGVNVQVQRCELRRISPRELVASDLEVARKSMTNITRFPATVGKNRCTAKHEGLSVCMSIGSTRLDKQLGCQILHSLWS